MAEEIFDIVNDKDEVIGQERRSVVHRKGLFHRGVHIWLFMPDGKLLIQRRTEDRPHAPGALDCSVSEHVKAGEDYLSAARRGLREELGLEGIDLEPVIKFRMEYGPNDNEISELFQGRLTDPGRVHFDPQEVASVEAASTEELEEWIKERQRPFARWFEQMLNWYWGRPSDLQIMSTHGQLGHF